MRLKVLNNVYRRKLISIDTEKLAFAQVSFLKPKIIFIDFFKTMKD